MSNKIIEKIYGTTISNLSICKNNPVTGDCNPSDILIKKIYAFSGIMVSVITTIAVGAIVYAGYLYILSPFNADNRKKANKVMLYTAAGLALATLSIVIIRSIIVNIDILWKK